ncbi:hypothetical protein M378DRAFT_728152 [Amanita muscaria Koide BX008]|uniref:Uncharacterized protein n=1 Tax=Amanita muscaria (strain Koide BX008) TaxID=946122 RepID=A0A0C2SIT9_AMAMK|nr:hypothetical protein M378DRAFT_728152 [Amanita muscaria Koide BX008]
MFWTIWRARYCVDQAFLYRQYLLSMKYVLRFLTTSPLVPQLSSGPLYIFGPPLPISQPPSRPASFRSSLIEDALSPGDFVG